MSGKGRGRVLVREARAAAHGWVAAHHVAGFRGAFLTGSAIARPLDDRLPVTSDVDVVVVVAGPDVPRKPKPVGPIPLDVSYLSWSALSDVDAVARSWLFAPSFAGDHVLADPTGHLAALRRAIAPRFAEPATVARRVDGVVESVRHRLRPPDPAAAWPEQVLAWLFPASLTTHVPLVAALRPPTVRLRYRAVRDVVDAERYGALLDVLGCRDVAAAAVAHHLDVLAESFDRAAAAGSSLVTPAGRAAAIDGSRALLDVGDHREAVFFLVAVLARCSLVLGRDAGLRAACADLLGVAGPADLVRRRDAALDLLPPIR